MVLLLPASAAAHDFWVEPAKFRVSPGASIEVRLKVGHGGDVKTVARKPDRILRLESVGSSGAQPLAGEAGDDPAGELDTAGLSGARLLVYQSNHAFIELEAEAFHRYLEHEGLDAVLEARRRRGELEAPGKERYARSAKALVTIGAPGAGFDRVLGLPIELVPLADPRRPGAALRFRLLFEAAPLAGARVDLMPLEELGAGTSTRTNAQGELSFPAPAPGRYLLAATHMVRARKAAQADWRSEWATFTFEVR